MGVSLHLTSNFSTLPVICVIELMHAAIAERYQMLLHMEAQKPISPGSAKELIHVVLAASFCHFRGEDLCKLPTIFSIFSQVMEVWGTPLGC